MATQAEVLDRFKREYQEYHRISQGRCVESRNLLLKLGEHAGKPVHECDSADVKSFLSALNDEGFMVTTIGKKLGMIKPFFSWCWEVGIIDAERYMRLDRIGAPRGAKIPQLPRPYSKKELRQFRERFDKRWPTVSEMYWKRWRKGTSHFRKVQPHLMRVQIEAVVALALHCGLRCREIFDVAIDDIHHDNAYVVVREGKGGKYREVPHTETSRAAVQAWLEFRAELQPKHDETWLSLAWESVALKPMRWDRFRLLMTTIPGKWELHRFRHTCGTEWLRHTKRLEIVQKLLGHARIQQTLGYAQLVNDDVLAAVAKAERQFEEAVA